MVFTNEQFFILGLFEGSTVFSFFLITMQLSYCPYIENTRIFSPGVV
jgi:hypothetical protein